MKGLCLRGDGHRNSPVTLGRETWSDPERCNTGRENKREELAQFKSRICITLGSRAANKELGSDGISDGGRSRELRSRFYQVGYVRSQACAVSQSDSSPLISPHRGTVNPPLLI